MIPIVNYLTPAKFEDIYVAMELEDVGKNFCTFRSNGVIPNFQLREKEYVIKPKSEKKKRLLDGEEHTVVTIELSFNAEAIAPTP